MRTGQITVVDFGPPTFHFRVGRELTAQAFPRIRQVLLQQLDCCREIKVDFSEVRVVDTMGVTEILAIRREALRHNKALHFVSRNEAFLKLLDSIYRADFDADLAS